jgi:hypothetical protein
MYSVADVTPRWLVSFAWCADGCGFAIVGGDLR